MQRVEICVEGKIDNTWAEWFEGFSVSHTQDNETLLIGEIPDPAALYGLISKLRDLGLTLVSVNPHEGKVN